MQHNNYPDLFESRPFIARFKVFMAVKIKVEFFILLVSCKDRLKCYEVCITRESGCDVPLMAVASFNESVG
jgi:hypothetical protein